MCIDDSLVLKTRIECTLDADGMFGYTKEQKIENLKGFKKTINNLLQNWMYPSDEYERLHQLQNEIDNHLKNLLKQ